MFAADTAVPLPGSEDFIRWIFQQGGLCVAIALLLYFWRRDMAAWRTEQERLADVRKDENDVLLRVVRDNSAAMVQSAASIASMAASLDRITTRVIER